ncbi:yippee zinc-binding/DNA-binding /Mis18, centromere assembly-domain-containing protein [Colletotrichum navitas]|uniref:Yippee zinc-binding/DNA-binding /Mis18, centromere assembly-domain-containing protein n=1 Tax=Colletotrichum navitas TaxID=681940 RepID=A0AAD8UZ33_9PEZI|nr:yippee zinc-binding/DNA-binding /Mis18, centromere assembly-domain-containing protein [Colletotrichum navitas]KAK1572684.1 yippee zinc-binding/DNA-binding /Mis18, centromere assembly-domain-containing protein [Colletotrichum navitas]
MPHTAKGNSSPTSSTTDETVTPPNSPPLPPSYQDVITSPATAAAGSPSVATAKSARPGTGRPSLARTQPDTLRCSTCSCDVAFSSQIVSKGFTGRYGRAYLVAPTPPPSAPVSGGAPPASKIGNNGPAGPGTLANVRIGKCENRQLVTGWHVVADITCVLCNAKLGWKYVDAKELSQRYKVGKFILEVERVVPFRSWEDAPADGHGISEDGGEEGEEQEQESEGEGDKVRDGGRRRSDDAESAEAAGKGGESDGGEEVDIVFDSEDEDDLEDLFSGNWDPEVVAKRRSRRVTTARKK